MTPSIRGRLKRRQTQVHMFEWLNEHETLVWTLTGVSVFMFIASLVVLPIVIVRIPADYFTRETRPRSWWDDRATWVRVLVLFVKNGIGVVLLLSGLAMLVLPGQGLLAIAAGLMLVNFPGKYRLQRWLVSKKRVHRPMNWLRKRAGKLPLSIG